MFRDEGDKVSRLPIYNNKELFPIISSVDFPGKEENKKRYEIKARRTTSYINKFKNKVTSCVERKFVKVYEHSRTYDRVDR